MMPRMNQVPLVKRHHPLPQSISQGSGFSDSSSSLNLDRGSHSNVQEKNVPPGDDSKVKGSTDQPRYFPE